MSASEPVRAGNELSRLLGELRRGSDAEREVAARALIRLGRDAVPGFFNALGDRRRSVRSTAAEALARLGEPGIRALCARFERHPGSRLELLPLLERSGDEQAAETLCSGLRDRRREVRHQCAAALGRMRSPVAVQPLGRILQAEGAWTLDSDLRVLAARALGRIADAGGIAHLVRALKSRNSDLQAAAAWALGEIGDPRAVPHLLRALPAAGPVRLEVAEALARLGDESAISVLCRDLCSSNPLVRQPARRALLRLDTDAVPSLVAALHLNRDEALEHVADVLREIGVPAVPALCQVLGTAPRTVSCRVAELLAEIGSADAGPALTEALDRSDPYVRGRIALALGELGYMAAVPALARRLEDEYAYVRWRAHAALGLLGDPRGLQPPMEALRAEEPDLRIYAARALKVSGSALAVPDLCAALAEERSVACRVQIVGALSAIAERDPAPALRTALPTLKLLCSALGGDPAPARAVYREAFRKIEAATGSLRHLPVPAASPNRSAATLPVPALTSVTQETLPGPAGPG